VTAPAAPAHLLAATLARDPARPLITFYDDATGERVELSAATTDNWVAKSANLLRDDLAVEAGSRVALLLPLHWQTAVLALATWALEAVVTDAIAGADVAAVEESRLPEALDAPEVLGLSLRPMNAPLTATPAGVVDYGAEVLAHGDRFASYTPVDPDAPALDLAGRAATGRELVAATAAYAVGPTDRLLTTLPLLTWEGLAAGLLAPLAAGAGVVMCRNAEATALERRAREERVTATAGVDVDGLPRLA
jgi:uncharacterized protein (TIGR03089 family)